MTLRIALVTPLVMYAIGSAAAAAHAKHGAEKCAAAASPAVYAAASQETPPAKPAQPADTSKYSGFMDLVNEHREVQVKMVKKWRELRGQQPPTEATMAEYKKLQEAAQKASNKVTKYIAQERWTEADRAAMNKIWGAVISQDVP